MQPNKASGRPIIVIDVNELGQGSDNPRTSSRQSSARTGQLQQGSLDSRPARQRSLDSTPTRVQARATRPWVRQPARRYARDKSCRARVTRLWGRHPASVQARVTQPTSSQDRVTRLWVRQPASCQTRQSKSHLTLEQTLRTRLSKGHSTRQ